MVRSAIANRPVFFAENFGNLSYRNKGESSDSEILYIESPSISASRLVKPCSLTSVYIDGLFYDRLKSIMSSRGQV